MQKYLLFGVFTILICLKADLPAIGAENGSSQSGSIVSTEKNLDQNSENPEALFRLGMNHMASKDYKKAIQTFNRLLPLNPEDAQVHYSLGLAHAMSGAEKKAWSHLKKSEMLFKKADDADGVYVSRDLMKTLNAKYGFDQELKFEPFFSVRFGYISPSRSKNGNFHETLEVPFKIRETGLLWGYRIKSSDSLEHDVSYSVRPPKPPLTISGEIPEKEISKELGSVTSRPEKFKEKTSRFFWFDKGDPLGVWELDVVIDKTLRKKFRFNVK